MSYIYDLTDTWNAAGTVFTSIKMNVTNSASANGSKLIDLQIGGTSLFNVDKSGNVGIGTSSPVSNAGYGGLSLNGSSGSIISMMQGGAETFRVTNATGYSFVNTTGDTPLLLGTNTTERMRIDSSGDVGVGTTTPISKLDVRSGYITAGTAASTEGSKILGGYYSSGNIATFGGERSNGGPVIGYGVWPSTVAEASFVSATAINVARGAYTMVGNVHKWFAGGAQTVAVDSAVSMSEVMRIDASGNLLVGNTAQWSSERFGITGSSASQRFMYARTTANGQYLSLGTNGTLPYLEYGNGSGLAFSDGATERMRIDSSGNVGIGTTSITGGRVQVKGVNNLTAEYNDGYKVTSNNETVYCQYSWTGINSNDNLKFATGATERARIDSSGNLLVGTTALPSGAGTSGVGLRNVSGVIGQIVIGKTQAGTVDAQTFYYSGTYVGGIQISDTATSLVTSSDARLKHDIVDAPEASSLIDAIKVRSFKWNADNSEQRYGMIAQELLEVAPEAVSVPADEEQMMGVDYSKLVPMLVKEIQSLRARVAQLEGK